MSFTRALIGVCALSGTQLRRLGFFLGPLLFVLTCLTVSPDELSDTGWVVVGLAGWMIIWWMTEAVPLSATALLPAVVFPLSGVMPVADAIEPYANPLIFLFLGGFIIAIAIQKCNLHLRIALGIVYIIGTRPDRIVGGFMVSCAFLSMWLSNTATMLMMLPICLSVVELMKDKMDRVDPSASRRFAICMLLAIAYASSVGGIGTLIGTPPNAIMSGYIQQTYGYQIGFMDWMMVGVPVVVVMVGFMWLVLTRWLFRFPTSDGQATHALIAEEISKLGRMSADEKRVAGVAVATAAMWMFHPALSSVIGLKFDDTLVALLGALALMCIPVSFKEHRFVMCWKDAEDLPWGTLILFGGGLSLAGGFESSGLAQWIGVSFSGASGLPAPVVLAAVITTLMLTTTLMSNVASINIFLPIIIPMAVGMNMNPLFLAIPATMAASCAFMLPVSTANNAIAFGTGKVSIGQMARAGLLLNIIALPLLMAATYLIAVPVFDIEPGILPEWVK